MRLRRRRRKILLDAHGDPREHSEQQTAAPARIIDDPIVRLCLVLGWVLQPVGGADAHVSSPAL
jgi:hypothetical protein